MAKHLNVNLAFTADTAKAKSQMQDLQHTLNDLVMQPSKFGTELTEELTKATQAAARLSVQLKDATNVDTGTLDFGKLNESMRKSGQTLSSYGDTLMKLGPQGQEAFLKVTQAVAKAEVPIRRSNKLVTELWTTLKNTARWQISSSILHSFMGALQSAYGYAQDLNASLNDIRIVTAASTDEMAKFAAQANRAARELSATTNEYAKASLIYFQQGLSGKEVEERTNVTIKMAKVTRDSAEEVSNQLTAIWNNFNNGTKSLEYYADAITALGAATASSTDEIAEGLEKFAAIANTVGLSYEYATSALATVTAETRQSADVVGTAFKTLFARLQDLELGKTLDDGTDLGKYSAALNAVGINIKDTSGELKDMDQIIDELGKKWNTLGKDTQIALAQTVAGTRQYTQLIALMDNYDVFERNLQTVKNSSGALEKQHKIYEEGWEAAADRVQAALEKVYATILDDDAFIGLLNGIEKMVVGVDHLIDAFGGLGGTLSFIGALATKIFSTQLTNTVSDLMYRLKGKDAIQQEKFNQLDGARAKFDEHATLNYGTDSEVGKAVKQVYAEQIELQKTLIANEHKFNEEEQKTLQILLDQNEALSEQYIQAQKNKEMSKSKVDSLSNKLLVSSAENKGDSFDRKVANDAVDQLRTYAQAMGELSKKTPSVANLQAHLAKLKDLGVPDTEIKKLRNELDQIDDSSEGAAKAFSEFKISLAQTGKAIMDGTDNIEVDRKVREDYIKAVEEDVVAQDAATEARKRFEQGCKNTTKVIESGGQVTVDWAQKIVQTAGVIMQVTGAINALHNAWETLKDPDVSGWEKFTTVLSTLAIVIPTVLSVIKTVKEILDGETKVTIANALAKFFKAKGSKAAAKASKEEAAASREATKEQVKETASDVADEIVNKAQSKNGGSGKFGKNGNRTFSGNYNAKGKPLDQNGQVIGQKYYSKAGLNANGKAIPKTTAPAAGGAGGSVAATTAGNGSWVAGMKSPAVSAGASLGIFLAGIAILAGTVAAVVWQMKKAERAVEKAKEASAALQENYDNVKASYDSLMSGASAYEDAVNNVNELTKGTVAYQEAVLKANEAASELLSTNKDLKYTIQDGQIVIDKESLEEAQEKSLKNMELAQAANMAGQAQLRMAEENLDKRDMARRLNSGGDAKQKRKNGIAGGILGGVGAGLATGAAVGAIAGGGVFSVPAALIGGAVGMIAGGVIGAVQATSTKEENEALEKIEAAALKDATIIEKIRQGDMSNADWKNIGIDDAKLITSLNATGDAVADLIDEMVANTAALNAQNDLVASNALANNEAVQNSEYADQIIDIAGDAYGIAYEKAMSADWTKTWGKKDISKINGANKEAKKIFDEYLKYAGLEGQGYKLTDTTGNDKNRKFVYEDAAGNEHTVSLQAMQAARAAYEASETLDDTAKNLALTFEKLASSGDKADQALLSFMSQKNFEDANKTEFHAMSTAIGNGSKDRIQSYLEESLGTSLTDEVAAQYGYKSADAWIEAFAKQVENARTAWSNITLPEGLSTDIADNLSLQIAQALDKQAAQINLGPLGKEAGKTYAEGLNKMLADLDLDEQQDALARLSEIDWSDWDALEQADAIMKEYGVDIDTTSKEWVEYANKMRIAAGATPDFSKLRDTLASVTAILQDLDFGSVISDEDYQRLVQYNDEWERYFMLQADGSRVIIGDSKAMQQEVRNNIIEQRKALQKRKAAQEGFDKAGWGHKDANDNWRKANWGTKSGSDTGTATNLMNASGATEDMLEELGYTDEVIQAMIDKATSGQADVVAEGEAELREMYKRIDAFTEEELTEMDAQFDEMMASTATSIEELNKLYDEGQIGSSKFGTDDEITAYEKQLSNLSAATKTFEELDKLRTKVKEAGGDLADDVYNTNIKRLSEEAIEAASSLEELAQAKYEVESRGVEIDEEQYISKLKEITEEAINSANSLEELQEVWDKALAAGIELDSKIYNDKLIELGKSYKNCADEVKAFEQALLSNNPVLVEEARELLEVTIELNELAEAYNLDAEATANYADRLADGNATTVDAKRAFGEMAIAAQRLDRGVKSINENIDSYKETLETANRTSYEFSETMDKLKNDIADMFNVADGNMFSDTFAEGLLNSEDFQKAIKGDIEALDRLRASAVADLGDNIIADLGEAADKLHGEMDEDGNIIAGTAYSAVSAWDYLRSVLEDGFTLEEINNEAFVTSLNNMISAAGMTKEQIQSMLGSMGVSAEIVTDYVMQETKVPTYTEVSEPLAPVKYQVSTNEDGSPVWGYTQGIKKYTVPGEPMTVYGAVPTYSIKTTSGDTTSGGEIDYSSAFTKASPPSISASSANAESKSAKSTKPTSEARKKKSDIVDRYKEVNDQLKKTQSLMSKNSIIADGLWGEARLKKMRENVELMKQENEQLQQKYNLSKQYLAEDKGALIAAANDAGLSFAFSDDGFISNYTSQMSALYARRENLLNSFGSEMDEGEQEILDDLDAKIDALTSAYDQYEGTLDEKLSLEEEYLENAIAIKEAFYNILTEELEFQLSFSESDLQTIDYYLNKIADDFYSMAEAVALTTNKFDIANEVLTLQKEHAEALQVAYKNNEITQANFIEGIQNAREAIYTELETLNSLDKEMLEYYGNTLSMAGEEIAKYTDRMDHLNSVLDHYQSLLSAIGKETDYKSMGVVLQGIADGLENSKEVAEAEYAFYKAEADKKKALMESAPDDAALELYRKEWEAAEEATREAQDKMLASTAEWAESMKAVIENKLNDFAKTLEESLTGGTSFDEMTTAIERATSLQEEYLTSTNQIYETTKMMRTAQKALDETTNTAAKNRLKGFIQETEQLQNQGKLSKYELDMQQAKYDLLLAEIALEEAQNAKSTVRLQRDAEGNFGYIYTADSNKVTEAQQKFDDAQNALYNKGLEGANDYTQKYQQTMSEMYDTMTELQQQFLNGEITTQEEYDRKMLEAQEYYYQKLQDYSNLYQVAVSTDSEIVNEAWSTSFADITYQTEDWMANVRNYSDQCGSAFQEWETVVGEVKEVVGTDLDELAAKVNEITAASDDLVTQITGENGVITALQSEAEAVTAVTNAYALKRQGIKDTITDLEAYALALQNVIAAEAAGATVDSSEDVIDDSTQFEPIIPTSPGGEKPIVLGTTDLVDTKKSEKSTDESKGLDDEKGLDDVKGLDDEKGSDDAKGLDDADIHVDITLTETETTVTKDSKSNPYKTRHGGRGGIIGHKQLGQATVSVFDTGGYTGDWGPEGKLAMLHQKELVLNQSDTANLLAAVDTLRTILQTLDMHSMSAQIGGILSTPGFHGKDSGRLEQNVKIEATFPNVQDHNEIEEAFNNLINKASQYANRK